MSGLRRSVLLAVAGLATVGWWQWPALRAAIGRDPVGDVLIVDDGYLSGNERAVGDRLREDGRIVEWLPAADWCDAAAAIAGRDAGDASTSAALRSVVVLSFASMGQCPDGIGAAVEAARASRPSTIVIVRQVGVESSETSAALVASASLTGAAVLDPSPLIGDGSAFTEPCEWWEACDDTIAVRRVDGSLTESGAGRVSRLLVELLR